MVASPKSRLWYWNRKDVFLVQCHSNRKIGAGPVGFEPTILGSEGPRLSPGSTTGPARSFLARQVLLFSMMLVFFRRPTATQAETGGHARPDFSVPTTSLDASKGRLQDEFTTEQECGLEKVEPHSLLELYFE